MRTTRVALLGLILSAGVSVAACDVQAGEGGGFSFGIAAGKAQDTWTRTYPLAPGGRLELINVNGRIDAEPASGTSVEVVGERAVKAMTDDSAKDLLAQIEMREEVSPSRVRVEVRAPRLRRINQQVKWTIKVPKGVIVDFRTTNGGVHMVDLQGDVHAQTVNGGVTGKRLSSTVVEASAVNGGVEIELGTPLSAEGRVELETVNGGVSLDLPAESKATITARAVNGGVRTSGLDLDTHGEQTRRRIEGTMNGGGARVSLSTTNGGVRLSRAGTSSSETRDRD